MAIMTSNFWTTMSIGRVLWAVFSGSIESAWPVIFAQSGMCLLSGVCLMSTDQTVVWSGAMLIGAAALSKCLLGGATSGHHGLMRLHLKA